MRLPEWHVLSIDNEKIRQFLWEMSDFFDNNQIYLDLIHIKSLLAISRMERDFVSSKVDSK